MRNVSVTASQLDPADPLHSRFLMLVPRLEIHARIYFRDLKCQSKKDDAIADTIALAWKWYLSLAERGKDPSQFVTAFVSLAARSVKSGRRICGQEKAKDVMSAMAQQRHGFVVHSLPITTCAALESLYSMPQGQEKQDAFEERLKDNTQTPVPDQAAFRCDFPVWRLSRTDRDRRVIDDLGMGERTLDVSKKYGIIPGRISQLRRDFMDDWERFTADPALA